MQKPSNGKQVEGKTSLKYNNVNSKFVIAHVTYATLT